MTNQEKYEKVFVDSFSIDKSALASDLEYNTIPAWDSVGHMALIAAIEDAFEISMEMDDIINFSSYNKGMELLGKYKIQFEV